MSNVCIIIVGRMVGHDDVGVQVQGIPCDTPSLSIASLVVLKERGIRVIYMSYTVGQVLIV